MKRKIKILVKRVQLQSVTISADSHDVPEDINGFVRLCEDVKSSPMDFVFEDGWDFCHDGSGIDSFEIVETE